MVLSVYTSLLDICETRPRREKNQGVKFECIEAGYHPVLFNCVHRSQRHVSNRLSEINFQFNIAPSRLWRSAFWKGPDQSSLPPNNRNLGWPLAKTGARYERGGLIVERFAIHSVRASFEPRASKQLRASQSPVCSCRSFWLSELPFHVIFGWINAVGGSKNEFWANKVDFGPKMMFLAFFVTASRQNYAFSQKIATQAYINKSKFAKNVKASTQTLRSCVVLLII